jgi:quinol monooxygenase YgiN
MATNRDNMLRLAHNGGYLAAAAWFVFVGQPLKMRPAVWRGDSRHGGLAFLLHRVAGRILVQTRLGSHRAIEKNARAEWSVLFFEEITTMAINRREALAGGAMLAAWSCVSKAQAADSPKLPEGAIIILAQMTAKPGKEEALKEACLAMVEPTRKEEGCFCYNLHQSKRDKGHFMFYEQWAGNDAIKAHNATAHMKKLGKALKDLDAKIEVALFSMVSE